MFSILHTEASRGWGGQEIRIVQESLKFTEVRYRVLIACQKGSKIAEEARIAGLPVHIIHMRHFLDPLAIGRLIRLIKAEKIDIIHTHSSKDSWLAGIAGCLLGIPVVRSRHLSTPVRKSWYKRNFSKKE
jgi:hypothetical protein